MAYQFLRGNTAANDAYTGPLGSLTVDTQAGTIRIHDGVTAGGFITIEDIVSIQAIIDSLGIEDVDGLQAALDSKASLAGGGESDFVLMPQVGGDSIVSSGTGATGSWVQFSSGYQIVGQRGLAGGSTWTFPQAFNTTDSLVVSVSPQSPSARFTGYSSLTTTTVDLLAFLPDETASTAPLSSSATGFYQ